MKASNLPFFTLLIMSVIVRESTAVDHLTTNTLNGRCTVKFTNGDYYQYSGVSQLALLNLKAQPNMSLGSWVNHNCVGLPFIKY